MSSFAYLLEIRMINWLHTIILVFGYLPRLALYDTGNNLFLLSHYMSTRQIAVKSNCNAFRALHRSDSLFDIACDL